MNLSKYLYIPLIILYLTGCKKPNNEANSKKVIIKNAVIAHRGMPRHAPEETAPSYWLAKKLGADYLEADLQRTKDGVIICLHDDNLKRTTNIEEVYPNRSDLSTSNFTLAELKKLDAGSWFNKANPKMARSSYAGLPLLTLNELIEISEADNQICGLYLETKNPELFPGIEKDLVELLEKKGWVNNPAKKLVLQTFSTKSLKLLNKYFEETPKCMLIWNDEEFLTGGVTKENLQKALDYGKTHNAAIIGPSFKGTKNEYYNLMEDWMVDLYRENGYIIHPYTFDTQSDLDYAQKSDGQFTNRTDLLLAYYQKDYESINTILSALNY